MYRVGVFGEEFWVLQPSWCLLIGGSLVVGMMASEERSREKSVVLLLLLQLAWCSVLCLCERERESLLPEMSSGWFYFV